MKIWEQALIGLMLGDGYLEAKNNKSAILRLKYSQRSLNYLRWLREILSTGLQLSEIKLRKTSGQYECYSTSSRELMKWKEIFYSRKKKIIPKNIDELLVSPLSLAIWYQDDGCLDYREKYHYNVKIATYCFTYKECCQLQHTLRKNFGIIAGIHKSRMRGKLYYHLYIYSQSMRRFMDIIKNYIHPDFKYKIRA